MVLFYSRRSQPCSEDAIALVVSSLLWKVSIIAQLRCFNLYLHLFSKPRYLLALFLWQIVPSVPKLYLKDLKYSAKKEHCEVMIRSSGRVRVLVRVVHLAPPMSSSLS